MKITSLHETLCVLFIFVSFSSCLCHTVKAASNKRGPRQNDKKRHNCKLHSLCQCHLRGGSSSCFLGSMADMRSLLRTPGVSSFFFLIVDVKRTWGVMAQLLFDFAKETTPARWLKQIKGPKIENCYCHVWLLLTLTIGCNLAIVFGCSSPPPESPTQAPSFPSPAQMKLLLNDVPSTGTYIL